jgi:hypothetical protein
MCSSQIHEMSGGIWTADLVAILQVQRSSLHIVGGKTCVGDLYVS